MNINLHLYRHPLPFLRGLSVALALYLFFSLPFSTAFAFTFIVNDSVNTDTTDIKTIRNIYTLQQRYWSDGKVIHIFVLPDEHLIHQQFCQDVSGILPHQYRRIWDRITFSGSGNAPVQVKTQQELIQKVSQTLYAIGYAAGIALPEGVRTLDLNADLETK